MADTIKIGSFDVSSFKVGSSDCKIYLGDSLLYPHSTPPHNYYNDYLTFEAIESGTFTFVGYSGNSLSYSLDNGSTWSSLASGVASPTVSASSKILWKGSNLLVGTTTDDPGIGKFTASGNFNVEGNIKSLVLGDNFTQDADFTSDSYNLLFANLFDGCTKIISAENMKFPTVYFANVMLRQMFLNCTEMTTAPSELPALTMSRNCYLGMFLGCSKLTKAPATLPATTLAQGCYAQMFEGCSSLVSPPSTISALALQNACMQRMFYGCSAMTTAPVISATSFNGTANCTNMFKNCVSLTTAPILRPTKLVINCYQYMFDGCSNLNSITCLATSGISTSYCRYWVRGVASSGTFTKAASASWETGTSAIPSNWTVVDYSG